MQRIDNHIIHGDWQAELNAGLSPCQAKVALGWAADMQQKSIAAEIGVQPGTVKKHCQAIYYKTRTNSATGALARLIKDGVLSPLIVLLIVLSVAPVMRPRTNASTRITPVRISQRVEA